MIEDWIGQGKPGQSLAEQLFGSRSELEQPFQQLNEISSEVYDAVVDAAEDLSTEEMRPLFGNNERVIIPMASEENEQVKEFYEQIVEPLAAKGIKVDLKNGVATKEIETQRGKQERKTKLGKTIGRELSSQAQQWWNKFQADFLGNPDVLEAQDAIVITQHPVDVARMSDFSEAILSLVIHRVLTILDVPLLMRNEQVLLPTLSMVKMFRMPKSISTTMNCLPTASEMLTGLYQKPVFASADLIM